MRMLTNVALLAIGLQANINMAEAQSARRVQMIESPISIKISYNSKCTSGSHSVTSYVACAYSTGGPFPETGRFMFPGSGSIHDAFKGDEYFVVKPSIHGDQLLLEFTDSWGEGDHRAFAQEIKEYYQRNHVTFNFTYFGSEFNIKPVGQPRKPRP